MKPFSMNEIEVAWKEYESLTVLRVLKDGKWLTRPASEGRNNIQGTSAQVCKLSKVMDFPEFLRDKWTR